MFVAVGVDCEGGDQHQVVFDLQAVDLAHHQVQLGQVRRLSASHSADCATNRREAADFEVPSLARRDSSPSGQASPRTAAGTLRREVLRIGEHSIHECDNSVTSLPAFCPDHSLRKS